MAIESGEAEIWLACQGGHGAGMPDGVFLNGKEAAAWNQLMSDALHATVEDDSEFQAPGA